MQTFSPVTDRLLRPIPKLDELGDIVDISFDGDSVSKFLARFRRWYGESLSPFPSYAGREFIRRLPEAKEVKHPLESGTWFHIPATDLNVAVFAALWPRQSLNFASEDERLVFRSVAARTIQQEKCAELFALYKAGDYLDRLAANPVTVNPNCPLASYQACAARCAIDSDGYALLCEQGTGKTAIAVAVACNDAQRLADETSGARMYRLLVICPKNLRFNWLSELSKFATLPWKGAALRGNQVKRLGTLLETITRRPFESHISLSICVVGYETATQMVDQLNAIEWDCCILDESHYVKSLRAQRTKTTLKLRDKCAKRMILTGTPITNTLLDLYSQLEFLGEGYSGFSSWEGFKAFHGVYDQSGGGFERIVAVQNVPFMQERLARLAWVVRKEEVLQDLPKKVYDTVEVEMTAKQAAAYKELAEQLMLEIETELDSSPKQLAVNNVLVKLLRLTQITSGFIKWDAVRDEEGTILQPPTVDRFDPNPKIDELLPILKEKGPLDKTIIWASFVQDIRTIRAAVESIGIRAVTFYGATSEAERLEAERSFNEDFETKLFIGNPAAGGVGLNLLGYPIGKPELSETNCNHIIYFSQGWSMPIREQSEARPHRRGTRVQVRITDLVVPETIDEEIRTRVLSKAMHALEIKDLRELLTRIRKAL